MAVLHSFPQRFSTRVVPVEDNIKMTWVLWPQAHFICPCPTLSKGVTGKSCSSLLPPHHQSFPSSNLNSASLHILNTLTPQHSSSSKCTHLHLATHNTVQTKFQCTTAWWTLTTCCFSSKAEKNWTQCLSSFPRLAQSTQIVLSDKLHKLCTQYIAQSGKELTATG